MVWGVEAGRQAGRLAVRQAHVVVERLVGHSVMPHNIDLQPVSEPHTPSPASPYALKLLLIRNAKVVRE